MDIIKEIGEAAALEQLAEECAELGKAALKLSRILRGENPTPVTEKEARENLIEEMVDVDLCLDVLGLVGDFERYDEKLNRWKARIKEVNEKKVQE